MKQTYYSSLFSTVAQIAGAVSGANKKKNNINMPEIGRVGIKFDIISAGKLHPGLLGFKNILDWMQKEVTSHL